MSKTKNYLQFTRAHTTPLEAVPAIGGAALALGTLWSYEVLVWGVFGMLYHLTGYGMNSYTDFMNGYDSIDPNKQHHPLNTGAISVDEGKRIVQILFLFSVSYSAMIIGLDPLVACMLLSAVLMGVVYNQFGKETGMKFIPIAYAHSMIFAIPYVSVSSSIHTGSLFYGTLFVFSWVSFQIGVSGEAKDINMDEENLLLKLGSYSHKGKAKITDHVIYICYYGRVIVGVTALTFSVQYGSNSFSFWSIIVLTILSIFYTYKMLNLHMNWRGGRIRDMAMIEMFTLTMFTLAGLPVWGITGAVILSLGSVLWVVMFNYIEWGTLLSPDV